MAGLFATDEKLERIEAAVSDYASSISGTDAAAVIDILADLRQFCRTRGLNFATLDRKALELFRDPCWANQARFEFWSEK